MPSYNLIHGSKTTNTFYVLHAAAKGGTTPTRRQKGWSDYDIFITLLKRGWIETRSTGPRGGKTYHATRKGRYHLNRATLAS